MSTYIKYNNEFGKEISSIQVNNLDYYSKIFIENNLPLKEETYINGNLVNTSYYIEFQSEIAPILLINPSASFDLIYKINEYKIHELLSYSNEELVSKRILVYDSDEKNICFKIYKKEIDIFVPEQTEKYFYDSGELKFTFEYNEDGTCFIIHDEINYQADIFAWNIGNPDYTDFTWTGFEYYENSEPLLPVAL